MDSIPNTTSGNRPCQQLLTQLKTLTDFRAERYWQPAGIINNWPGSTYLPLIVLSSPVLSRQIHPEAPTRPGSHTLITQICAYSKRCYTRYSAAPIGGSARD
jgi:hypothetical protein